MDCIYVEGESKNMSEISKCFVCVFVQKILPLKSVFYVLFADETNKVAE